MCYLDSDSKGCWTCRMVLQHPFFVSLLPRSSHVDVLNERGPNEAERAGVSQLPPHGLTAASWSTPPKFRAPCQPPSASPKGRGEERIQIETDLDLQPIGASSKKSPTPSASSAKRTTEFLIWEFLICSTLGLT